MVISSKTPSNYANCYKMCLGEKKILRFYIDFVRYCLPLFDMSEKVYFNITQEIKEKMNKDFPDECPFEFYIVLVILKFVNLRK